MAKVSEIKVLQEIIKGLVKNDITPIFDGPSIILMDKKGNKVIDFTNGLGPVGQNITMMSKLETASMFIKKYVEAQLSDNQFLALASFVSHVGQDNFIKSGVLRELNKNRYEYIPMMLQRWRKGAVGKNKQARVRPDFIHRRQFEAELFVTPDIVKIDFDIDEDNNKMTWKQLTIKLRKITRKAFQELRARQAKGELLEIADISNLIKLATKLENPLDEIVIGGPVDPGGPPGTPVFGPGLPKVY
tara:strand:- start:7040 stop:7774 length:735 start_codon:yes stop_codon:yes gene_type:complete